MCLSCCRHKILAALWLVLYLFFCKFFGLCFTFLKGENSIWLPTWKKMMDILMYLQDEACKCLSRNLFSTQVKGWISQDRGWVGDDACSAVQAPSHSSLGPSLWILLVSCQNLRTGDGGITWVFQDVMVIKRNGYRKNYSWNYPFWWSFPYLCVLSLCLCSQEI